MFNCRLNNPKSTMTSTLFPIQKSAIAAQLTPLPAPPRFASRGLSLAPRSARLLANFGFTEGMAHYPTPSRDKSDTAQ
jgi:hypothetical protein